MDVSPWAWTLFAVVVLVALGVDLFGHRERGAAGNDASAGLGLRSSAVWSAVWVGLGLSFGAVVYRLYGSGAAVTYVTAYLLEKSLSVDNIFVFALIFEQLRIPAPQQRRVLYWGIIGALVMRALLLGAGTFLLGRFHWVIYPFAALIVVAAVRIMWGGAMERRAVEKSCAVCTTWVARFVPITPVIEGGRFWIRQNGRLLATPLLIALVIVETSDVVFALDSVPAVLAVTREPFLVYTSNVFAMLGLRSLYFLIGGVAERFHAVRYGLGAILLFVGAKMLLADVIEISAPVSLAVIVVALGASVVASLLGRRPRRLVPTA